MKDLTWDSALRRPWLDIPAIAILLLGITVGLVVAAVMVQLLMEPSLTTLAQMTAELAGYAAGSAIVGFVLYQIAAHYSRWLNLTLALAFIWAAALTLYIVYQTARHMFASADDLVYAIIFVSFAAVIATAFSVSATMRTTRGLRRLAQTAQQVSAGQLSVRAPVVGRDEVAQLTATFNRMAEQLEEAADRRKEVQALRRNLIAWTSHDLRTPLTGIRAMVEALHDGVVTDEPTRQRYYGTMRSDIISLNQLIDDLFELAQLDTGGRVLDLDQHSLSLLVQDVAERFKLVAEQAHLTLKVTIEPGLDPVRLNPSKAERVLANLLSNALRYTPAGGEVVVTAGRTANEAQVAIRDNGPGFREADLPHVFEQFYRGEEARSRSTGGAGLGLAIASGIMEAHNGRIWAANAPAGGALITFAFPLKER